MTPLDLLESLRDEIKTAVKNFKFEAQNQPPKPVSVYLQSIPKFDFENDSFYPLVVVELLGIEDDVEISIVSVLFTLGTYNGDDGEGWRDHLNLLEKIRQFLMTNLIIGGAALELPLYSGLVEKNSENFTFSNIFARYQISKPVQVFTGF